MSGKSYIGEQGMKGYSGIVKVEPYDWYKVFKDYNEAIHKADKKENEISDEEYIDEFFS